MSFKGTVGQRMCLQFGWGISLSYHLRRVGHWHTSLGANNAMVNTHYHRKERVNSATYIYLLKREHQNRV